MSDQLVAEAANYTAHYTHRRRTSMPSAGFEAAVSAVERPEIILYNSRPLSSLAFKFKFAFY